jgi:hypothetical protein
MFPSCSLARQRVRGVAVAVQLNERLPRVEEGLLLVGLAATHYVERSAAARASPTRVSGPGTRRAVAAES